MHKQAIQFVGLSFLKLLRADEECLSMSWNSGRVLELCSTIQDTPEQLLIPLLFGPPLMEKEEEPCSRAYLQR